MLIECAKMFLKLDNESTFQSERPSFIAKMSKILKKRKINVLTFEGKRDKTMIFSSDCE